MTKTTNNNNNDDTYFGMIPNNYFYDIANESENNNTILEQLDREQVSLLILYNIQALKSANRTAYTSILKLIKNCGYTDHQDNIKKFRQILKQLEELNYISIEENINKSNKNELLTITTQGLDKQIDEQGFFMVTNKEIETLLTLPNTKGRMTNALAIYFYLKARTYKYTPDEEETVKDYYAPTTFQSVEFIQQHTFVKKVFNAIKDLEELELISVKRNMQMTDKKGKIYNCGNIYLINSLLLEDKMNRKEALKQGFDRYKYYRKKEGFSNFKEIEEPSKKQQTTNKGKENSELKAKANAEVIQLSEYKNNDTTFKRIGKRRIK